jgi:tight adherence protein C
MMEPFQALLDLILGPDGMIYLAGIVGIGMIVLSFPALLVKKPEPLDRIARQRRSLGTVEADGQKLSRREVRNEHLAKYAQYLDPQNVEEMDKTRKLLMRAGYTHRDAVRTLTATQFLLSTGLLLAGVIYSVFLVDEISPLVQFLAVAGPGAIGYYGPRYWVHKRIEKRVEDIRSGFPDALDLLLVCVEAGQSLDQSIIRVAAEIEPSYPALAQEFLTVAQEMKAGRDRRDVLRAMGDRCDIPDITSFVTVLIQSQTFGTSVADALRVYAAEMRDKRIMRAEEKANVLPTKLTVGTMMFCVPPLLIILIGPSIHGVARDLGGVGY